MKLYSFSILALGMAMIPQNLLEKGLVFDKLIFIDNFILYCWRIWPSFLIKKYINLDNRTQPVSYDLIGVIPLGTSLRVDLKRFSERIAKINP